MTNSDPRIKILVIRALRFDAALKDLMHHLKI